MVPAGADRLWRALTDPAEAGSWLGGHLEWVPEEGHPLRFVPGSGEVGSGAPPLAPSPDLPTMEGQVMAVIPGRYLRFRWWPEDGGPDMASEVAYVLEPAVLEGPDEPDSSTVLTVEEAPVGAAACADAVCSAGVGAGAGALLGGVRPALTSRALTSLAAANVDRWTGLDSQRLEVWAETHRPTMAMAVGS